MRYLITGGCGYIGTRLTDLLCARDETEAVVLADVRPPASSRARCSYVKLDVRDRAGMAQLLAAERIDALVHLAFILNPIRDEALMYDIDVNGTHAVLQAAAEAGTQQILVTSSTTAYGAFPDNPKPIAEDHPVRGVPEFSYARDKTDADRVCQLWAAEHPDRTMTIVRPCIVLGPNVDNYISRSWQKLPEMTIIDGIDADAQFVHEDDVVSAIAALLDAGAPGAFNVTGDGTMTWRETAEIIGMKVKERSFKAQRRLAKIFWTIRFPKTEAPPGILHFFRYPWVASNEKIKAATEWRPQHTTRETFESAMRAKGLLGAGAEAPIREPVTKG